MEDCLVKKASVFLQQRSPVPKFGNWESGENVPYTVYFDEARKGRKLINPNDPQENPDAFSNNAPLVRAPSPSIKPAPYPNHETRPSKEDGKVRQITEDFVGRRAAGTDSPHQRDHGGNSGRSNRLSNEQSPLHPIFQAKVSYKNGVSSPSWERKGSSERSHGFAPTPGRSKLRPTARGDETWVISDMAWQPQKGAAVPKFGDWDESNPAAADGYTHIFNKVREEKQTGVARVPVTPTESSYHYSPKSDYVDRDEPMGCPPLVSYSTEKTKQSPGYSDMLS
ncbi:hypothetical protein ACLOJK_001738 [Asimina triloba]